MRLNMEYRSSHLDEVASSPGNSLLGFLWNEYEQKKTGEEEKSEGGGAEKAGKTGRSCLPNLNTVRCELFPVPRVPKGIILSKTLSLNSKIITPPSKKEKIVISKW